MSDRAGAVGSLVGPMDAYRTYELLDAAAGESVEAAQLALVCQLDGLSAIGGAPDLDTVVRLGHGGAVKGLLRPCIELSCSCWR